MGWSALYIWECTDRIGNDNSVSEDAIGDASHLWTNSQFHSCQQELKKMRDVLLTSLAFTLHLPHQHLEEPERGGCPLELSRNIHIYFFNSDAIIYVFAKLFRTKCLLQWQLLRFSAILTYLWIQITRWRYHCRFRRALSNKMSPYSERYCDFQRFLLFLNKAGNAGRSRKNAGIREISQNAGYPARLLPHDCGTVDTNLIHVLSYAKTWITGVALT